MRTLFGMLDQLGRAKRFGVEIGIEAVLHAIEQRHHATGIGGPGQVLLRTGALEAQSRYARDPVAPFCLIVQSLAIGELKTRPQRLDVPAGADLGVPLRLRAGAGRRCFSSIMTLPNSGAKVWC